MLHAMTAPALRHFVLAHDLGNLTAAAEQAGVTQPAISKSIRKLEEQVGGQLFERRPQGLVPTRFGRVLRHHAQNILNEIRFVSTEIAAATGGTGGQVRIGVGPIWSLSVFPALVADLRRHLPGVDLVVQVGIREKMLPQLAAGDLDLWLGSLFEIPPGGEFDLLVIEQTEMRAFAPADHPLASLPAVAPADLAGQNWAGFIDDDIGLGKLAAFFAGRGLAPPRIALKSSSVATMFAAARDAGLLVYAAGTLAEEARLRGLVALPVTRPIWAFETGLACRHSARHIAAIEHVFTWLTQRTGPPAGGC